ncbi:hypothetical protein H0H92_013667 [Tricholoma furcatifolium]|nr:hypothetical protein H0H92_013667 [Tricholoma furcatifolium]
MFTKHTSLPFVAAIGLGATLTTAYCAWRLYNFSITPKTKAIITSGAGHGELNENELDVQSERLDEIPTGVANNVNSTLPSKPDDSEIIMTLGESNDINLTLQAKANDSTSPEQKECLSLKQLYSQSTPHFSIDTIRVSVSESVDWNAGNLSDFGPWLERLRSKATVPSPQSANLVVQLQKKFPAIPTQDNPDIAFYFSGVHIVTWESHRNQLPLMFNAGLHDPAQLPLSSLTLQCEITKSDCACLLYEFRKSLLHFHVNYILCPGEKLKELEEIPRLTLANDHLVWRSLGSQDRTVMELLTTMRLHAKWDLRDLVNRFKFPALTQFWLMTPNSNNTQVHQYPSIRDRLTSIPWNNIQTNVPSRPRGERHRAYY